jgi:hypothetical protein
MPPGGAYASLGLFSGYAPGDEVPAAVPKRAKKTASRSAEKKNRSTSSSDDEGEAGESVGPKRQTMEALQKLLAGTTTESRLRENASSILQLFSDLPPYSLFHEEDNKTLDAFEELLTTFLSGGGQPRSAKVSPQQPSTGPSLRSQVINVLSCAPVFMRLRVRETLLTFPRCRL